MLYLTLGCNDGPKTLSLYYREVCEDNMLEQADFIVRCAEAANPKSDEEGEDLVDACYTASANIFCNETKHICVSRGDCVPCASVTELELVEACKKDFL